MKFTSTLLCSFICLIASAQVTIDFITFPPLGDSIMRFVDPAPQIEVTEPGPNQDWVWTLNDQLPLTVAFDSNDREDVFPLARYKVQGPGLASYYTITDEQWNLLGTIGEDPVGFGIDVITQNSPGFRQEYAPIMYADTFIQRVDQFTGIPLSVIPDSLLDLLPLVPDSMRTKVSSVTRDEVDAWGTLSINGNEPIDVLRQRRVQRIEIAIEAKISILPWQDITNLILNYLDFLPEDFELVDTFVNYRYLAPNYGFPMADIAVANDTISGVTYQQEILSSLDKPKLALYDISVFPNPAYGYVNIELPENESVMRLMVIDAMGRPVSHVRGLRPGVERVDVSSLPAGLYLLTIWDEGNILMGTSRLTIQY